METEGGFSYALIATIQIVTRKTSDKKHLALLSAFLSHFEQIAVCACAYQIEQKCIPIDLIDEQPVRCDVTLPATCIISRERMISQDGIVRSFEVHLTDDEMAKLQNAQKSVRAALDGAGVK